MTDAVKAAGPRLEVGQLDQADEGISCAQDRPRWGAIPDLDALEAEEVAIEGGRAIDADGGEVDVVDLTDNADWQGRSVSVPEPSDNPTEKVHIAPRAYVALEVTPPFSMPATRTR